MKMSHFLGGFRGGVSIRGIPVLNTYAGNVFWVDSNASAGSDTGEYGNHGQTALKPFKTINYAITRCTANNGDIILVAPGHAEAITAAAGIVAGVIGVTVIALGTGDDRATLTFSTATTADLDIDAANVSFVNFRIVNSLAAMAAPIDVNAAGFALLGCDFYLSTALTDIDITVITDANANDIRVEGCNFYYLTSLATTAVTATATECVRLVGADRAIIKNNYIGGDFTTSAINGITTASKEVQITDNDIHNIATENIAGVVDLVAACTGVIARNHGFIGYSTGLATVIDPSSCAMIENYFSNVVTEAGGLVGTAST